MPELPEVETIAKKLNSVLRDKLITKIKVHREKSFQGDPNIVIGQKIIEVSRRAKLIRFHFPEKLNLLAHLKMTGQFIFIDDLHKIGGGHPSSDWVNDLPSSHTRVEIDISPLTQLKNKRNYQIKSKNLPINTSKLFFNDMRVFGWLKVLSDAEVEEEYQKYGPDINTENASYSYFKKKLKSTARKIKQVVMDNKIISGVGNIYACDGLNLAKVHPMRPANSLSEYEIKTLLEALKEVIDLGIKLGGATISDYKNVDGFSGKYQDEVRTYGRDGLECKNCFGIIEKIKIGGRGTFYCSKCQI